MCRKHKTVCTTLNHIELCLILATGCISISSLASLLGIPIGITSSEMGLKTFM